MQNYIQKNKAVWGSRPAGSFHAKEEQVGTKKFFETVLEKRFTYECDFLPELVRYQDWENKKVLEIGCGAGFDAYMFCKYGADYTGIDIVSENIERTKIHLSLYGYEPKVFLMNAHDLEKIAGKFDLIYSIGVLHHIPDMDQIIAKMHDKLNDNGKVFVAVYNKNSVFYWVYLFLFDWILRGGFKKEPFATRLARIEYTLSDELPFIEVYTKKNIKKIFQKAQFNNIKISVRNLTHDDLPKMRYIEKYYHYIPESWLKKIGSYWGWYICVEAEKSNKMQS